MQRCIKGAEGEEIESKNQQADVGNKRVGRISDIRLSEARARGSGVQFEEYTQSGVSQKFDTRPGRRSNLNASRIDISLGKLSRFCLVTHQGDVTGVVEELMDEV